jgi:hypothetical protein
MRKFVPCLFALAVIVSPAKADWILSTYGSGTPKDSWAYSKLVGAGHGNSSFYQPLRADWAGAVFQGYVHSDPTGAWNTIGAGTHDEDTIYVFKTYAISNRNQTIGLHFDGDDGHSLYVNNVLIGGGGFGAKVDFNLFLKAGVPVKIEMGDYNGPGPMGVELQGQIDGLKIESTPGVSINATPEPTSFALFVVGLVPCLLMLARHQRAVSPV